MVTFSALRAALATAIEGLAPGSSYSVPCAGLADAWTVSPDPGAQFASPRDLQVGIRTAGIRYERDTALTDLILVLQLANYHDTRSASGSLDPVTAEDRIIGACDHLVTYLRTVPLPGGVILTGGQAGEPALSALNQDGAADWYAVDLRFTLLRRLK